MGQALSSGGVSTQLAHYTEDWIGSREAIEVGVSFAGLSVLISVWHIYSHLSCYTMPSIQSWVLRILFLCPVYAICSAGALVAGATNGMYLEIVRDLAEALAVYSLLHLILEYSGGEVDCVYAVENEPLLKMPCPLCLSRPRPRDAKLLRYCQRGVLQFVAIKPFMAFLDATTFGLGVYYNEGYQGGHWAFLWHTRPRSPCTHLQRAPSPS